VSSPPRERVVVNVGCGPPAASALPEYFDGWRVLRVDVDPNVRPDVVADLTDLSPLADASADAVWAAHCIEHLYEHQVPVALGEFRRVLRADGFACILVPDLQTVASYLVADRLHEPLYDSPAGPITPHDVLFGFGAAIAAGRTAMAHRCGFTPALLRQVLDQVPFAEVTLHRHTPRLELLAVASAAATSEAEREALLNALAW
jgi:SAM-dependent methyltransferase